MIVAVAAERHVLLTSRGTYLSSVRGPTESSQQVSTFGDKLTNIQTSTHTIFVYIEIVVHDVKITPLSYLEIKH